MQKLFISIFLRMQTKNLKVGNIRVTFTDVVTFDKTYLTNKYDMPFAFVMRVNHHG